MRALVIYDSNLGNTKLIAETIAGELGDEARAVSVTTVKTEEMAEVELLVVGSPIIGWKPTVRMQEFLAGLRPGQLKGIKATTFDTRVKLFIHGDAAKEMAKRLKVLGAEIMAEPMPFYVRGKEGPLLVGEVERARDWAKQLLGKSSISS
jgi:flavodoxin